MNVSWKVFTVAPHPAQKKPLFVFISEANPVLNSKNVLLVRDFVSYRSKCMGLKVNCPRNDFKIKVFLFSNFFHFNKFYIVTESKKKRRDIFVYNGAATIQYE